MNREWAELNRTLQCQIKKAETFENGIETILHLRHELFETLCKFKAALSPDDFSAAPYLNADGYHSKTVAYSIWHILRIEDIVAHALIARDEQIFVSGNYARRVNAPVATTGNELDGTGIVEFSKALNLDELYNYLSDVVSSTNQIISNLTFSDLKRRMTEFDKERLKTLNVVSADEKSRWLIDYWCGKNIKGLIQMPLTRHWIMHVEACLRIVQKIRCAK